MKNLQEFILFLKPSSYQDNDLKDNLDNEVYLWYEDFLKDEDDLDNEVYLWYEDFLEDANILQDEDILKDKDNLEDWVCPCKDVHWYLCNGATVDATI